MFIGLPPYLRQMRMLATALSADRRAPASRYLTLNLLRGPGILESCFYEQRHEGESTHAKSPAARKIAMTF